MRHRRLWFVLLGLAPAALALACGSETAGPAPLGNRTPRDGGTELTIEASTADREADEVAFRGTLSSTAPVDFGGPYMDANYCRYRVTLKNIELDMVVADGKLVGSTVKNQMAEEFVGTCGSQQPTIKTNLHTYALSSAVTATNGGFRAEYLYASGNEPKASLVIDLTPTTTGYTAAATWHRNDIAKPFDWTVTGTIPLARE